MINFDIPITEETKISKNKRTGIMLCYPFEEKRLQTWKPPFIIQPKLDGVRCRAIVTYNTATLITSENNIFSYVPHINAALLEALPETCIELDGELYLHGMTFQDIIKRTSRSKNQHIDSGSIEYHIFDIVSNMPQIDRLAALNKLGYYMTNPCLKVVPPSIVTSFTDIMGKFEQYIGDGYEGFIIRDGNAPYQRKRYTGIMKFKPHQADTYVIAGYSQEVDMDGNVKADRLGKIICMTDPGYPTLGEYSPFHKLPDGYFGVGTGFTSEQRYLLWRDREFALQETKLKVKYQSIFPSGSPRFPVALEIVK